MCRNHISNKYKYLKDYKHCIVIHIKMSIQQWNNNISMINSIIDELIHEEGLQDQYNQIKHAFQDNIDFFTPKRLEYKSFDEINRLILSNMNQHIEGMRNIKATKQVASIVTPIKNIATFGNTNNPSTGSHTMRYTKEDLIQQRQDEFNQKFKDIQQDFNNVAKNSPPKQIDFSDKTDEENVKIDNLIEEELKRRKYDYISTSEQDKKNAEKWIHNSSTTVNVKDNEKHNIKISINDDIPSSTSNHTPNHISNHISHNINTNTTVTQSNTSSNIREQLNNEKPKDIPSILKKVTFSDLISNHEDTPDKQNIANSSTAIVDKKVTQSSNMKHEGLPDWFKCEEETQYNYLVVNKYAYYEDNSPIWTKPVRICLNHVSQVLVKLLDNSNNTIICESLCIVDKKKSDDDTKYYRILEPFKINKNIQYTIKTFNSGGIELHTSLKHSFNIGQIFSLNTRVFDQNSVELPINYENILIVKLDGEINIDVNDIGELSIYIQKRKFLDVKPLFIKTIKSVNGITQLITDNDTNPITVNSLILDKSSVETIFTSINEITNIEVQLPYIIQLAK